jgi:hypothetical protein
MPQHPAAHLPPRTALRCVIAALARLSTHAALALPLLAAAQSAEPPVVSERMVGVERDMRPGDDGGSDDPRVLRGLFGVGLTLGGSRVASTANFQSFTPDLYAGNFVQLNLGAQVRLGTRVSAVLTAGHHIDEASDDQQRLRFSRFPIEAIGYLDLSRNVRLGGGARYVDRAWLTWQPAEQNEQTLARYGHNLGWVGELEYLFQGAPADSKLGVKLRYVRETYPLRGSVRKFSGSHVGLFVTAYF